MVRIQFRHFADERGLDAVRRLEDAYECPLNDEVETFFKEKALDFTNRKSSITHRPMVLLSSASEFLKMTALLIFSFSSF